MTDPVYTPLPTKATLNEWSADEFSLHLRGNFAVSPAGIVEEKGDLPVAAGANTMGKLSAGSNTQIVESDLTQALKMKNSWAFVPVGGIIMWTGALGSLPSNWKLCDGTNGTPDLRNKFVIGAGGAYNPGNSGGANSQNLQHSHATTSASGGAHTHTIGTTTAAGSHSHGNVTNQTGGPSATEQRKTGSATFMANLTHTHQVNLATESAHSHTSPNADSTGGHSHSVTMDNQLSSSQDTRPPFYQLAYIMRVS